ncbi:MAG: bacillithiol biosynthesis BshC [Planctomycetota bacterium]
MTSTLRPISFRRLGTAEVHQRYLENDTDLTSFLGARPRTIAELLQRAPKPGDRLVPRAALCDALQAYAERHGAPAGTLASIAALREPATQCVVTGQQPGLLGGPLFTFHKVATAIRLCRELAATPGGPKAVPVFWNHSDDHDLEEANRLFLINQQQEVQRFRLEIDRANEPLCAIQAGAAVRKLLAEIEPLLPPSLHRDWLLQLLQPRASDETLGAQMARLLFAAFGHHGLVIVEPRDLPAAAFEPLKAWWQKSNQIRDKVKQACDDLGDVGIDVTLDPATTMMFELTGGIRQPLGDGEEYGELRKLSPGVLLRPLWQDACLPTLAFVVGPGELSYLCTIAPLYKLLGVPMPAFVPRASLTLVEPAMQRLLSRFSLDLPDLDQPPEKLAERLLSSDDGDEIDEALDGLQAKIQESLAGVSSKLAAIDASMLAALDRARSKAVEEIERLQQKVRNARQNREGTGIKQLRRLCSTLRPRNRIQERVLGPVQYLCAYGPKLADMLVDAADPFLVEHGMLELGAS